MTFSPHLLPARSPLAQTLPFVSIRKRLPFFKTFYRHLLDEKCHTRHIDVFIMSKMRMTVPRHRVLERCWAAQECPSRMWAVGGPEMDWPWLEEAGFPDEAAENSAYTLCFQFLKNVLFELLLDFIINCKNRTEFLQAPHPGFFKKFWF